MGARIMARHLPGLDHRYAMIPLAGGAPPGLDDTALDDTGLFSIIPKSVQNAKTGPIMPEAYAASQVFFLT